VDQLRAALCPDARCSRRDYHLSGFCGPRSSYEGDCSSLAAASALYLDRQARDLTYRTRNVGERCVNKLKQWRAVATRYEKRAVNYRAMVVIASLMMWLSS